MAFPWLFQLATAKSELQQSDSNLQAAVNSVNTTLTNQVGLSSRFTLLIFFYSSQKQYRYAGLTKQETTSWFTK